MSSTDGDRSLAQQLQASVLLVASCCEKLSEQPEDDALTGLSSAVDGLRSCCCGMPAWSSSTEQATDAWGYACTLWVRVRRLRLPAYTTNMAVRAHIGFSPAERGNRRGQQRPGEEQQSSRCADRLAAPHGLRDASCSA